MNALRIKHSYAILHTPHSAMYFAVGIVFLFGFSAASRGSESGFRNNYNTQFWFVEAGMMYLRARHWKKLDQVDIPQKGMIWT